MLRASTTLPRVALLAIVLAGGAVTPGTVHAEIHRCRAPGGGMVYTDRPCEEVGAAPAPGASAASVNAPRRAPPRTGCARNIGELVLRISNAISRQDTNQLAEVYHWTGMSGSHSRVLLHRLDGVAHRPLAGIFQVMPPVAQPADGAIMDAGYYAREPIRQRPVALRIEQSSADGITPSHTVFGLYRHFGCWWIRG